MRDTNSTKGASRAPLVFVWGESYWLTGIFMIFF
jgi:hypothetical protein